MSLLGKPAAVGEISEIKLQLYSIQLVAAPICIDLYGRFELRLGSETHFIDPIEHKGPIAELWGLIGRTPTVAEDDGQRFVLKLDDGSEVSLRYASSNEHAAIYGPADNNWTPLPDMSRYAGPPGGVR